MDYSNLSWAEKIKILQKRLNLNDHWMATQLGINRRTLLAYTKSDARDPGEVVKVLIDLMLKLNQEEKEPLSRSKSTCQKIV